MHMKKRIVPIERARELLIYDAITGQLFWKVRSPAASRNGGRAGTRSGRYIAVKIDGVLYRAHRVIWALIYGKQPEHGIDHINGIPDDNRLENLRDVPQAINVQNTHRKRKDSGLDYAGVYKYRNKFGSHIHIDGYRKYLGLFENQEEAHQAYLDAKRKYHEGFTK